MPAEVFRAFAGAGLLGLLLAMCQLGSPPQARACGKLTRASVGANALPGPGGAAPGLSWHDSLGDGFPDSARLDSAQDRENFTRWFTFLAETQYYAASPRTRAEIQDCAALVRFAYRNSLVAHSPAGVKTPGFLTIRALGTSRNTIILTGRWGGRCSAPGPAPPLRGILRKALSWSLPTAPRSSVTIRT